MGAWGVRLGNAYISGGSSDTTPSQWESGKCLGDVTVVGCMTNPPQGLGIPGLRTEDIVFAQRDGTTHFNDWYESRIITIDKVMVCATNCQQQSDCCSAREKLQKLLLEWRRSCCDIELVIYTDCNGLYTEGTPILGQQLIRRNLVRNPSFEEDTQFWSIPQDSFCRTYDRCYTEDGGTTWCYNNAIDGAFTATRETVGGWAGDSYYRLTCDITPSMPGIGFTYAPPATFSPEVVAGISYTASAYMRSSAPQEVVSQILWFDLIGTLLGVTTGTVANLDGWTRVSVSGTAPEGAVYAHPQYATTEINEWVVGGTLDIDAALFEVGSEIREYFDGDTDDETPTGVPNIGEKVIINRWTGNENLSISIQSSQTYEENLDRSLYGPVGIVGRPRVAEVNWVGQGSSCAEVLLRFDAADQKMYLLDECGTPGYQQCRTVTPGLIQTCRSYNLCYAGSGRCYTDTNTSSPVLPVTVPVRGTERVFPLIVLYPGLSYPTIENMESGEYITFNGEVLNEAIQIDTENGVAKGVSTGSSYTHLLGGSIFLSITPGDNQFRMFSNSSADTGNAAICWRDTIVSIQE